MTLSLNCKDAGDPVYTHTMYGKTEEIIRNAKKHGISAWIYKVDLGRRDAKIKIISEN